MSLVTSLLPEFDHEMGTTRRLLDRVPDAELGWRPHDKSMSLGELSGHLANLPMWCSMIIEGTSYDVGSAPDSTRPKAPASRAALVGEFDEKVRTARAAIAGRTDAELLQPWSLKRGSHVIFTMPKISVLRSFVLNHSIHHRGQLSVYLRLKNVPLPSIYGPTADEQ